MSRIQLALNVDDVQAATAFYTALFGVPPAKTRPGYANFAVAEPPLKLVLLENRGRGGTLNHLGIEVGSADDVAAVQQRLTEHGMTSTQRGETTCCYAEQDKFWLQDVPDGVAWEVYAVLADSPTASGDPDHDRAATGETAGGPARAAHPGAAVPTADQPTATCC